MRESEPISLAVYPDGLKAGFGDLIVKVDQPMVDEVKTMMIVIKKDPSRYENMNIHGEIVSVPKKLRNYPLYQRAEGWPVPAGKMQYGKPYCTAFEPRYVYPKDQFNGQKHDDLLKPGMTVYFHYLTLRPENYLGKDGDGKKLFKCPIEQVFCYLKECDTCKGKKMIPHMLNGYVLVNPFYGDDIKEIDIPVFDNMNKPTGKSRKVKVTMGKKGLVASVHEKPQFRTGIVARIGNALPDQSNMISRGMRVVYTRNSEWKNTINGVEYFVMRQWDIVATIVKIYDSNGESEEVVPIGGWTLVQPLERKSNIILSEKIKKKIQMFTKARVLKKGELVDPDIGIGNEVICSLQGNAYNTENPSGFGTFLHYVNIGIVLNKEK